MYHIIGGDDQKHGPVDEAKIREWIAEGRANAQSKACKVGESQWRQLLEFTEFASEFKASAPVAPPLAAPHQEQGDATGGIIPYKNKHALTIQRQQQITHTTTYIQMLTTHMSRGGLCKRLCKLDCVSLSPYR